MYYKCSDPRCNWGLRQTPRDKREEENAKVIIKNHNLVDHFELEKPNGDLVVSSSPLHEVSWTCNEKDCDWNGPLMTDQDIDEINQHLVNHQKNYHREWESKRGKAMLEFMEKMRPLDDGDSLRAVVEAELTLNAWWHQLRGCGCGKHVE